MQTMKQVRDSLKIKAPGTDVNIKGFKVKQTSPGVHVVKLSEPPTPKVSQTERKGVGGSKARMRHKGRIDPKAADPRDPGVTAAPPSKVNNPTTDKNVMKGYIVGKGWPASKGKSAGNPYAVFDSAPQGAGGVEAEGPY